MKWETRRLDDILERVIPHFIRYPLLSGKRGDFERFAVVCEHMRRGAHREREGLIQIVEDRLGDESERSHGDTNQRKCSRNCCKVKG